MAKTSTIDNFFSPNAVNDLTVANEKLQQLITTYTSLIKTIGEGINFKPTDLSELAKKAKMYDEQMKKLHDTILQLDSASKAYEASLNQAVNLQQQGTSATVDAANANKLNKEAILAEAKAETERLRQLRLLNAEERRRKPTAAEITSIMSTQAKSIAEAAEQNRKLQIAVRNVSDDEANAAEIRAEYNRKIEENTRYIRENSDAQTKQRMTIGDYKNQILEAMRGQGSFTDRVKATINILKEQKGAILVAAGAFAAYKVASFAWQQMVKFVTDAVQEIKEFEKANSVLASILGTTRKEIKELTMDARRLGETTAATAAEVTQLQTELAKLGFNRKEILDATESVLQFALATGADLPDAAALAGAALRIFGADADEMSRYVSAMAISTNKSALSFSKLATAIPIVAPVANAFGFEIEDVLALLAKLSDAGFDASMAATATRNIFLNLADSGGKLAKALGRPVTNIKELQEGLIELNKRGIELAEVLELSDKRSVAALATFIETAEGLTQFRDSISDVNEEMKEAAEERTNNLSGSLTKLESAWKGLMLTFSEGAGTLKTVVDWMTNLVGQVTKLASTSEELSDKRIAQKRREAREQAQANKEELEQFARIEIIKKRLIAQGVEEEEAEKKATKTVRDELKERYDEQIALEKKLGEERKKLEEKTTKAGLATLTQVGMLDFFNKKIPDIITGASSDLKKVVEDENRAVLMTEKYLYLLEKIDKKNSVSSPVTTEFETNKQKRERERQLREAERLAKERLKIEHDLQESLISLEDDGYEKERAQLIFNWQKKIDAVKGQSSEEMQIRKNLAIQMSREVEKFDKEHDYKVKNQNLRNELEAVKKNSLEELNIRLSLLQLQQEKELKEAEKTGIKKEEIERKYLKRIEDLYNDFYKNQFSENLKNNEILNLQRVQAMESELLELGKLYVQGKKNKADYEKEKYDIQYKYSVEALQNELALLEESLPLLSGEERLNAEKKIAQLRMRLSGLVLDNELSNMEKEKKAKKELERLKIDLAKQASSTMFSIANSIFENQLNNIEKEMEANEKAAEEEKERLDKLAENEIITTEEAEARKRATEERTAQRNKELEKQKAALQVKQAKFQKAQSITETIMNTAVAIMAAWKSPFLAPAMIATISAMGALQLAAIMAQPIPKYAKGTDNHPGGLAVVGDGGKSEGIVIDGKVYKTPSIPTLVNMPAGAMVLPDITSPEFLTRCLNHEYWLTHNERGEPVQIINNFDTSVIERGLLNTQKEIRNLGKVLRADARRRNFNDYINRD